MRQYGKSRRELFIGVEKQRLAPLPAQRFSIGYWSKAKVHIDYHIAVEKSFYSVPYNLTGKQADIKYTGHQVTVYHEGVAVARHLRTLKQGQYVTDPSHMPHEHRFYKAWSPERIRSWGTKIGPNTARLREVIMQNRRLPEHGFRSCLGIIRLARSFTPERLERASGKALEQHLTSCKSIRSMLENDLDNVTLFEATPLRLSRTRTSGEVVTKLEQLKEQLGAMKLHGMAEGLDAQIRTPFAADMEFTERLRLLVEQEKSFRENRKLTTLLRQARLRYPGACIEELHISPQRDISKATVMELGRNEWIKRHRNLIITGPTGVGKTWLAYAFGVAACRVGIITVYVRISRLLHDQCHRIAEPLAAQSAENQRLLPD